MSFRPDPQLRTLIYATAAKRGVTLAQIIREALHRELEPTKKDRIK